MADDAVSELAQRLRDLKERTGCSYTRLAGRAALSRSTVHRYCSGAAVPPDFDTVSRLALACGADRDQLLDLHRMWVLASVAKPAPGKPGGTADLPGTAPATPLGAEPPAATADPALPAALPGDRPRRPRPWWWRRLPNVPAVAVFVLLSLVALSAFTGSPVPGAGADAELKAGTPQRLLFSTACASVIVLGEHGQCVRRVQALLKASGTKLTVDGHFGVDTMRRVMAFQALAGLPPTGQVDDATKEALVARQVSMRTWSEQRVERRIREVFRNPGIGDEAVHVARCHSHLDPLWVGLEPEAQGWGVFQLTDEVLGRYDGTQHVALDPEWNIQAAHWIWAEHRDFRAWPDCPGP